LGVCICAGVRMTAPWMPCPPCSTTCGLPPAQGDFAAGACMGLGTVAASSCMCSGHGSSACKASSALAGRMSTSACGASACAPELCAPAVAAAAASAASSPGAALSAIAAAPACVTAVVIMCAAAADMSCGAVLWVAAGASVPLLVHDAGSCTCASLFPPSASTSCCCSAFTAAMLTSLGSGSACCGAPAGACSPPSPSTPWSVSWSSAHVAVACRVKMTSGTAASLASCSIPWQLLAPGAQSFAGDPAASSGTVLGTPAIALPLARLAVPPTLSAWSAGSLSALCMGDEFAVPGRCSDCWHAGLPARLGSKAVPVRCGDCWHAGLPARFGSEAVPCRCGDCWHAGLPASSGSKAVPGRCGDSWHAALPASSGSGASAIKPSTGSLVSCAASLVS